jgi:hypothetical protein
MSTTDDLDTMRAMRAALPPRLSALITLTDFYGFTAAEYDIICASLANLYIMGSKLNTSERMNHFDPLPNHTLFRTLSPSVGVIPLYLHEWYMEGADDNRFKRPEETWMDRLDAIRDHAEAEATAAGVLHDTETHTRLQRARFHLKRKKLVPPPTLLSIAPCESTSNIPEAWRACQYNRCDYCASHLWNHNFAARSYLGSECDDRTCDTCTAAITAANAMAAKWVMPLWFARVPGNMNIPDFLASKNLTNLVESHSTPICGPETSLSQSHIVGGDESLAPRPLYSDSSLTDQLPLYPDASLQPTQPITMPMIDFGVHLLSDDNYRHDRKWNKDVIDCTYARQVLQTSFPKIIPITPEQQRAMGISDEDTYWIRCREKAAKYLLTFTHVFLINSLKETSDEKDKKTLEYENLTQQLSLITKRERESTTVRDKVLTDHTEAKSGFQLHIQNMKETGD